MMLFDVFNSGGTISVDIIDNYYVGSTEHPQYYIIEVSKQLWSCIYLRTLLDNLTLNSSVVYNF